MGCRHFSGSVVGVWLSVRAFCPLDYPMSATTQISGAAILISLFGICPKAQACTVCMGANGALGEAANGAIFVMLGVLFLVLGLISMVGYSLVRRGQAPLPAHAEFSSAISSSNLT